MAIRSHLLQIFLQANSIGNEGTTVLIILLLILLAFSFAVSGAEVAYFTLSYKDVNMLKTKQHLAYKRIVYLLEQPKNLLATLLIANSLINIAIIIISNLVLDNLIDFSDFAIIEEGEIAWVPFAVKAVLITAFLVLFAEIMPKVMATQNNIRFAKDVGFLVEALHYVFGGLGKLLVNNADIIEKKLASKTKGSYSLQELDEAIEITSASNANEKERNILKGIVKFGNITVKQIMKTRLDVNGLPHTMNFDEVVKTAEELHYSRLPVYKSDLDEVIGILHTKDMLPHLHEPANFNWHTLVRPPYFVHEHKLIEDLLADFQQKHIHFAVVVDEFGGTSGIVTLEDIMEEIIGDIKDEFDEEDADYKKLDANNYIFEGKTMLQDVCRIMGLDADTFESLKGESDSLAGLVLEVAGEIPQPNQIITVGMYDCTVLEVVKNRVKKIKITIKSSE